MRTLLIGSGAREHAIAEKLAQSPLISELFIAPGNAGTASVGENVPIAATDIDALLAFAIDKSIEFTVVGPEDPLALGIVDTFQDEGLLVFGPAKEAAQLESSKVFSKDIMLKAGVPTGLAKSFTSFNEAKCHVEANQMPIVIKADGLAAGKGVIVAATKDDAIDALERVLVTKEFGSAGDTVLVEECLTGQEISVFAFIDGEYVSPMIAACDYKRIGEGDIGPNTGGMGSYSPPRQWDASLEQAVLNEVMQPIATAMCERGTPYVGALYAGLMLTKDGPKVIEFNCRLGDPETQVVLPRLKTDLAEAMLMTARGQLGDLKLEWDERACVGVVLASGGYPGSYDTGFSINGLANVEQDAYVYHAGTKPSDEGPLTSGGRVLTVSAQGNTLQDARFKAYENVSRISFEGAVFRRDIALFD